MIDQDRHARWRDEEHDPDPNEFIEAVAIVMRSSEWESGGGWISGVCTPARPDDECDE